MSLKCPLKCLACVSYKEELSRYKGRFARMGYVAEINAWQSMYIKQQIARLEKKCKSAKEHNETLQANNAVLEERNLVLEEYFKILQERIKILEKTNSLNELEKKNKSKL